MHRNTVMGICVSVYMCIVDTHRTTVMGRVMLKMEICMKSRISMSVSVKYQNFEA